MNAGCVCQAMAEFQDRNLAADSVKKHYVLICLAGQGVIRLSPDLSRVSTTYQYRGEGGTCNYNHDQIFIVGFIIFS